MAPTDVTVEILKDIREEMRGMRGELTQLRVDLTRTREDLSERIGGLSDRVEAVRAQQVETELRLSTELVAVVGAVNRVTEELRAGRFLRATVEDHEKRITALEQKKG